MSETALPRLSQGCKNHPPLPAKVICRACSAPLCSLCSKFIDGQFLCDECIAASAARKASLTTRASGQFRTGVSSRKATRATAISTGSVRQRADAV